MRGEMDDRRHQKGTGTVTSEMGRSNTNGIDTGNRKTSPVVHLSISKIRRECIVGKIFRETSKVDGKKSGKDRDKGEKIPSSWSWCISRLLASKTCSRNRNHKDPLRYINRIFSV